MADSKSPQGEGHEMLEEWALWSRGGLPGKRSWNVEERTDKPMEPTPPQRVLLTDKILGQIGKKNPPYLGMVKRYYLDAQSYWEVAGHMELTTEFVKMSIQAVCDWVVRLHEDSLDNFDPGVYNSIRHSGAKLRPEET